MLVALKLVIPSNQFDFVFPSLRDDMMRRSNGKIGIDILKIQKGQFVEISTKFPFDPNSKEGDDAGLPKDHKEFSEYIVDRYEQYKPKKFRLTTSLVLTQEQILTVLEVFLGSTLTEDLKDYVQHGNALLYPIVKKSSGTEITCGIMEDGVERELLLTKEMEDNLAQLKQLVTVSELAYRRIVARDPYEHYIIRRLPINSEGLVTIGNFILMFPGATYNLCIQEIRKRTEGSYVSEISMIDKKEYLNDLIDCWCPKSTIPTMLDRLTILQTEPDSPIRAFELNSVATDITQGKVPRVYMRFNQFNRNSSPDRLMALVYKLANVAYSSFVDILPYRIESTPVRVMPEYVDQFAQPRNRILSSIIIRVPMIDIVQYRSYQQLFYDLVRTERQFVHEVPRVLFLDSVPSLPTYASVSLLLESTDGLVYTLGNKEYLVSSDQSVSRTVEPTALVEDGLYPSINLGHSVYGFNKSKKRTLSSLDYRQFVQFEQVDSSLIVTSILEGIPIAIIVDSGLMNFVDLISLLFSRGLFFSSYAKEYIDLKSKLPQFSAVTMKGLFDWGILDLYSDSSDPDRSKGLLQQLAELDKSS